LITVGILRVLNMFSSHIFIEYYENNAPLYNVFVKTEVLNAVRLLI